MHESESVFTSIKFYRSGSKTDLTSELPCPILYYFRSIKSSSEVAFITCKTHISQKIILCLFFVWKIIFALSHLPSFSLSLYLLSPSPFLLLLLSLSLSLSLRLSVIGKVYEGVEPPTLYIRLTFPNKVWPLTSGGSDWLEVHLSTFLLVEISPSDLRYIQRTASRSHLSRPRNLKGLFTFSFVFRHSFLFTLNIYIVFVLYK